MTIERLTDHGVLQILIDYGRAIFHYWWVIVFGAVGVIPTIWKWFHRDRRDLPIPHWLRVTIAVAALFLAQLLAYRDSIRNLDSVIADKAVLSSENWSLSQKAIATSASETRSGSKLVSAKSTKVIDSPCANPIEFQQETFRPTSPPYSPTAIYGSRTTFETDGRNRRNGNECHFRVFADANIEGGDFHATPEGSMEGITGGVGRAKQLTLLCDVNSKFKIQATITSSTPINFACIDREY